MIEKMPRADFKFSIVGESNGGVDVGVSDGDVGDGDVLGRSVGRHVGKLFIGGQVFAERKLHPEQRVVFVPNDAHGQVVLHSSF